MIQRVTHTTIQRSTLRNLQGNLSSLAALQGQLSSGKKISVPSDDPAGTGQALSLRATTAQLAQYQRNAQDGDSWMTTVDTALTTALGYLRNARDLVVQSGNGGLAQNSRNAIADNIDGLKEGLLAQANVTFQGRTVFAGTSDDGVAFDPTTYDYKGNAGASVQRKIGTNTAVRVDTDGSQAFGWTQDNGDGTTTPSTVFALLDQISTALRTPGTSVTGTLDDIDAVMQNMLTAASSNGSRQKVLENTMSDVSSQQLTVKSQLSGVEDIDLPSVLMDIQLQETVYQGALAAGARVLQPSLLDFLR